MTDERKRIIEWLLEMARGMEVQMQKFPQHVDSDYRAWFAYAHAAQHLGIPGIVP